MIEQDHYSNKTLFTKTKWRARFGAQIYLAILNHAGLIATAWGVGGPTAQCVDQITYGDRSWLSIY